MPTFLVYAPQIVPGVDGTFNLIKGLILRLANVSVKRGAIHTPLRYPGGKSRLSGFLRDLIVAGGWQGSTYAEPYAGGAGAALTLLIEGTVPKIAINDLDPCIFSFWSSVTKHPDSFIELIERCPLTIDEWKTQRDIYKSKDESDPLALGFATFYLNRTNRSGVLNAGVIGGQAQAGTYRIDARFNRDDLVRKVRAIGERSDDIQVSMEDGAKFIERVLGEGGTFIYADPPYFDKGSLLYMNSFDSSQHEELAKLLNRHPKADWLLTYDDAQEIRALYRGRYQGTFELPYSAHRAESASERMIMSSSVARALGSMG